MSLLRQLTEKPWAPLRGAVVAARDGSTAILPKATLGLRMLLAVITVLFSLLIVAYAERMELGDWRPLAEPWLLWLNTGVLILSSAALHGAVVGARQGRIDRLRAGLLAGGVLAFAFLAGQLFVWRELAAAGYFAATNPSVAFFYLITGLHALHLLGGLVAWGWTTDLAWQGRAAEKVRLRVELCAVYWHFLLIVWLVLFGLLLFT